MLIRGEIDKTDVEAFITHFVDTSKVIRKRFIILSIIYAVLTLIAFKVIISDFTSVYFFIYLLILALYGLLMPSLFRKRVSKVISGKIEKTDLVKLLGPYTLELKDKGIEIDREIENKVLFEWENIQRIYVNKVYYFFYFKNKKIIIVPIEHLETVQEEFLELLQERVEHVRIELESEKIENKKPKVVLATLIIAAIVGMFGYNIYSVQPQHDFADASKKVVALFEEPTIDAETGKSVKKIKASTNQEKIDEAIQAIARIDTTQKRYEIYSLPLIALMVEINEAQKQLEERERMENR